MNAAEYANMYREEEGHWWYLGMRRIVLSILRESMLPPNPRVLDAGCGTGFAMGWLRLHYAAVVTGLDISARGLDFCRRRGEQRLIRGDVSDLPLRSGYFDLATSFDVLSHVAGEDSRLRALEELARVLEPGGYLLIRVAAHEWLRSSHDDEILTHHRYCEKELRESVASAGFTVIRSTYANTILFPAAVVWRMLKKARLAPGGSDVRPATRGTRRTNRILMSILESEAALLGRPQVRFPTGLSLFLLARKPEPKHEDRKGRKEL
jgi:SAM-dependent methyltransferase